MRQAAWEVQTLVMNHSQRLLAAHQKHSCQDPVQTMAGLRAQVHAEPVIASAC